MRVALFYRHRHLPSQVFRPRIRRSVVIIHGRLKWCALGDMGIIRIALKELTAADSSNAIAAAAADSGLTRVFGARGQKEKIALRSHDVWKYMYGRHPICDR